MSKFNIKDIFHGFSAKMIAISPEITLVSGILSVLAGTIYACAKSAEANEVIEKTKSDLRKVEQEAKAMSSCETALSPETIKQLKHERGKKYTKIYVKLAVEMFRLYGLPALFWAGGMGFIINSHVDLRRINKSLATEIIAGNKLFNEYRSRVRQTVGDDIENKLFFGAKNGTFDYTITDKETGEQTKLTRNDPVFTDEPGSIFAIPYDISTTDILYPDYIDEFLDSRIEQINRHLEIGYARAYNGIEIYKMLGVNEDTIYEKTSKYKMLLLNGISGNGRLVPDPEMRKLKVTKLSGYKHMWDPDKKCNVTVPCMYIDPNFYPLEGRV